MWDGPKGYDIGVERERILLELGVKKAKPMPQVLGLAEFVRLTPEGRASYVANVQAYIEGFKRAKAARDKASLEMAKKIVTTFVVSWFLAAAVMMLVALSRVIVANRDTFWTYMGVTFFAAMAKAAWKRM